MPMRGSRLFYPTPISVAILLICCSGHSPRDEGMKVYPTGEQAIAGPLLYNVISASLVPDLGPGADAAEDSQTRRFPQERFYLVQIRVSNSSGSTLAIPALALVDDSGKTYSELTDGTGVQNWLGVVRSVGPTQTSQGFVVFDAPARHYRLRVTEEFDRPEVSMDLPLDFAREELRQTLPAPLAAPR